jgi:histone arginine demethylase JMJD6
MNLAAFHALKGVDRAKHAIANHHDLSEWNIANDATPVPIAVRDGSVDVGAATFHDNTQRYHVSNFIETHGDTLPQTPAVLTDAMIEWEAFRTPGFSWSIEDLAARSNDRLSLDGGPAFARMSICRGKVTLTEYERYSNECSAQDLAPLYVFDPDILSSSFLSGQPVQDEYGIPQCFSADVMECLTGSRFRPLPPAWLLVGTERSGTPIHDHPMTVAWNALLVGCKLWCCLPPDVDEGFLLLNFDGDGGVNGDEFDKSAIDWFQHSKTLPEETQIIVQRPGEIVYLPAGWFHVVLNVETSTAISCSLTLRRDLRKIWPMLLREDKEFAKGWLKALESNEESTAAVGVSLEDISWLKQQLLNDVEVKDEKQ